MSRTSRWILNTYLVLFFLYLFLPLGVVAVAAFNAYPYPSVTQWRGFTLHWFSALLEDRRLLIGLGHSGLIGLGVVAVALPLGLAGAFVLTHLKSRWNTVVYAVLVSPILVPGILLGISTLVFWSSVGVAAGLLTATLAQATFIASYAMLMILARLQRLDPSLEEAALDLGASPALVFWRLTLPFLRPTLITAAVLAFLQSIENYNTTVFAIGADWTLVTEIGSRFRFGLSPVINVIGVLFIGLTVGAATLYVLSRRRTPA
ncbi:ABC transporter permease [Pararhodospirillum photometricum]|uniref:ABC-type spermidine/putrescine transport system n=1 Tax=Pararhodospirillum photometricum DSM 122 TaxID=1150469 RepID=H6SPE2_PARPM|nr:ABC transporter permease [Pararhodospirillum photometricum]CCG09467.1 ABC-type spermidine/putrescine transport system [Pararhodospirillum photometricum DSM 122]